MTSTPIHVETSAQPRLRGFALIAVITSLMLTLFLEALDQTIVGTALPRIIAELHGLDRYSWVVTAYILASMTMIPIVGKLSDQFGRKWFLLAGTLLFLLGSVLAGASQTMNQLIAFRGVQGLGAGIGMALIATVMADLFPPAERAKWMGLFGAVYGISSLLGPTFGGWLTEHGPLLGSFLSETSRWRWVFYINLPIGVIAVVALLIFLPAKLAAPAGVAVKGTLLDRIDFLGAILCAAATICLILGLSWGGQQPAAWISTPVIGALAIGILLLILFLYVEQRANEPILPLDLFHNPVFSVGALLTLLQSMVLLGLALYLPLFFQGVLAVAPTSAGLVMTPFSLSMVLGAVLSSMAINQFKRYRMIALVAALLMCVGAALITRLTLTSPIPLAIAFMAITGVGIGAFFSLPTVAVQNALPASQLGVGTAAVRYLGQVGATLGIAIVGTVVSSAGSGDLMQKLPTTDADKLALSSALQHGFVAVLVFALIALAASFFLKDMPFADAPEAAEADTDTVQELSNPALG
ncbi:MAG: MDR family MFS transporter [Roseiflexaceae bacterium]